MNLLLVFIEFVFLLICAAFFSGTETAVTAVTRPQYRNIKKSRLKANKRAVFLIDKKNEVISSALIGTNFINTLSSSLITAFVIQEYGAAYIPAATAVTTILIIIFAEIMPKAAASQYPVEITIKASFLLAYIRLILKPITDVFSIMTEFIAKILSKNKQQNMQTLSKDYLKTVVNISLADGTFQAGEHFLISRAVKLHELKVYGIMTNRNKIIAADINSSFDTVKALFKKTMFSRLPIFSVEKYNIVGTLHYKDLLFCNPEEKTDIRKIMRQAIFIPKTANIFSALKTMNKNKQNMAFVITEYGDIAGLITIDDISSAIFGSIQDEYGKKKHSSADKIQTIGGMNILIPANFSITKLNEMINTNFHSDYHDTMGGLILEKAEYLPMRGESITIDNITFTIEKVENSKIISLKADLSKWAEMQNRKFIRYK